MIESSQDKTSALIDNIVTYYKHQAFMVKYRTEKQNKFFFLPAKKQNKLSKL